MHFRFCHNSVNVLDLERSVEFYRKALGLVPVKRKEFPEFTLIFLGDGLTEHLLELTWLHDRTESYDLGDNELHLAFRVDDLEEAHRLHESMGCICFENQEMGLYFIEDPDGYWIEILPEKR